MPGPGSYEVGKLGINSLARDVADIERKKHANNFNNYKLLQYKMNVERYNYQEKMQRHIDIKKDTEEKVGPGTYIDPKQFSEFHMTQKPEYL